MASESWQDSINDIQKAALQVPEQFPAESVEIVMQLILLRARDSAEDRMKYWERELGKIDHRLKLFDHKGE